ncbi:hypothetical protein CSOJ01_02525 [Colletotrichum sojae]|uniref:Peptidase S26 domain-containing protein n=1 Tax=Colletotrichum sojae TaxID=2175907 RepID=A0A8H6JRH7_9PEZI|nr:hypothetical protein CSOJ01_02525 [Colletotrichum sojae]
MAYANFLSGIAGHPLRLALNVGKTIAAAHLLAEYGFSVAPASGASMLPTFDVDGNTVVVDHRYRHGRGIVVGDLVSYSIPIFKHSMGIKRVLGMPGDYVLIDSPDSAGGRMIQVPQGHCWIVGDNIEYSRDSRTFGAVPLALIKGKAVLRGVSMFDWQVLENGLADPKGGEETRGS